MTIVRIALANVRIPASPGETVIVATEAIAEAGAREAQVICFPECFVPGYRWLGQTFPPPDQAFLERAWAAVADAARSANITVILGTERITERGLQISACVFNADGTVAGWHRGPRLECRNRTTGVAMPAIAIVSAMVHYGHRLR